MNLDIVDSLSLSPPFYLDQYSSFLFKTLSKDLMPSKGNVIRVWFTLGHIYIYILITTKAIIWSLESSFYYQKLRAWITSFLQLSLWTRLNIWWTKVFHLLSTNFMMNPACRSSRSENEVYNKFNVLYVIEKVRQMRKQMAFSSMWTRMQFTYILHMRLCSAVSYNRKKQRRAVKIIQ